AIFWLGKQGFQRFPLRIRQVCRHTYQRSWLRQPRKFSDFFLWMIYETTSRNITSDEGADLAGQFAAGLRAQLNIPWWQFWR
ncbi:MAG: hypothetical protein WBP56_18635, partial [Polyangia bacterium]